MAVPSPLRPHRTQGPGRPTQTRRSDVWGDWAQPDRPTSVEFQIWQHGGTSSAVDLLPCRLQWSKRDPPRKEDQLLRAVYESSYLRAENAYYRKVRRAAVLFRAEVAAVLLGQESVVQLRDCLEQVQQMMSAAEGRRSIFVRPSTPRIPFVRGVSRFRTAVDDYTVALDRIAASFHRLDQALAEFTAALRRIDQEYADFFSVQLSNEPPQF